MEPRMYDTFIATGEFEIEIRYWGHSTDCRVMFMGIPLHHKTETGAGHWERAKRWYDVLVTSIKESQEIGRHESTLQLGQ